MIEVLGDLWKFHDEGNWVCVTTNGTLLTNGNLVMGGGCAKEAKQRYPTLPSNLGKRIKEGGNRCYVCNYERIISFPTKEEVYNNSLVKLIEKSAKELVDISRAMGLEKVYIPRPGCDLGGLNWKRQVKPVLENYFMDNKFIIVNNE